MSISFTGIAGSFKEYGKKWGVMVIKKHGDKKIYNWYINFFLKHPYLNFFCLLFITVFSGAMVMSETFSDFSGVAFFCSVYAEIRIVTYKKGKIHLFMSDKTWNSMRAKHSEEKADELYKEMSLKHAAIFKLVSVIALLIAVICEIISTTVK